MAPSMKVPLLCLLLLALVLLNTADAKKAKKTKHAKSEKHNKVQIAKRSENVKKGNNKIEINGNRANLLKQAVNKNKAKHSGSKSKGKSKSKKDSGSKSARKAKAKPKSKPKPKSKEIQIKPRQITKTIKEKIEDKLAKFKLNLKKKNDGKSSKKSKDSDSSSGSSSKDSDSDSKSDKKTDELLEFHREKREQQRRLNTLGRKYGNKYIPSGDVPDKFGAKYCGKVDRKKSACLYLYTEPVGYNMAWKYCKTMGKQLAMLKSKVMKKLAKKLLSKKKDITAYIGLDDQVKEGKFKWNDGSKLRSRESKGQWNNRKNRKKFQKKFGKILDCVYMAGRNGKWEMGDCNEDRMYICEDVPKGYYNDDGDKDDKDENVWCVGTPEFVNSEVITTLAKCGKGMQCISGKCRCRHGLCVGNKACVNGSFNDCSPNMCVHGECVCKNRTCVDNFNCVDGTLIDCGSDVCKDGACVCKNATCVDNFKCLDGTLIDCGSDVCKDGACVCKNATCVDNFKCVDGTLIDCGSDVCKDGACVCKNGTCVNNFKCVDGVIEDCGSGVCIDGECRCQGYVVEGGLEMCTGDFSCTITSYHEQSYTFTADGTVVSNALGFPLINTFHSVQTLLYAFGEKLDNFILIKIPTGVCPLFRVTASLYPDGESSSRTISIESHGKTVTQDYEQQEEDIEFEVKQEGNYIIFQDICGARVSFGADLTQPNIIINIVLPDEMLSGSDTDGGCGNPSWPAGKLLQSGSGDISDPDNGQEVASYVFTYLN